MITYICNYWIVKITLADIVTVCVFSVSISFAMFLMCDKGKGMYN